MGCHLSSHACKGRYAYTLWCHLVSEQLIIDKHPHLSCQFMIKLQTVQKIVVGKHIYIVRPQMRKRLHSNSNNKCCDSYFCFDFYVTADRLQTKIVHVLSRQPHLDLCNMHSQSPSKKNWKRIAYFSVHRTKEGRKKEEKERISYI